MTGTLFEPRAAAEPRDVLAGVPDRPDRRLGSRRILHGAVLLVTLAGIGLARAWNVAGWPAMSNDDEGTYLDRAWAVQTGLGAHHGPAPYTYWYDHPPFGWMQLAVWTWLTRTFRPGVMVVASGRAAMVLVVVVTAALVYLLARRLGCRPLFSLAAVALFGLSPLSLDVARMVMLDTIGLPWVVAAFALACSPKRRLAAAFGSGACFAGAVLSKETYLLLLPAVVVTLWLHWEPRLRRMAVTAQLGSAALFGSFYVLYAALKGELLPGKGHVSLLGAIEWQLAQRSGSGSVFNPTSASHHLVAGWLHVDPWLLGLGLGALPVALVVRRLRGVGLAYLTFCLTPLRPGYLPDTFVTGALPFAALVAAASLDALWSGLPAWLAKRRLARRAVDAPARRRARLVARHRRLGQAVLLGVVGALAAGLVPSWIRGDGHAFGAHENGAMVAVSQWLAHHLPRNAVVLTDDDIWPQLVDDGLPPDHVVWFWEFDLDPAVRARFPGGWRDVQYVVGTPTLRSGLVSGAEELPQVVQAVAHSVPVVRFGSGNTWTSVRRVVAGRGDPPWWLPGYGTLHSPTHGPQKGERL
ncbi:ArnT family glycosyltransferase [Aciditerrimonas ferrireducens]|uniref:ArnT family glycosyltransferase n=1 Tax=Aciditerrimonas ferrireducens TaxID=667306 RepID=A0ABV6C4P6_9ACTN